MQLSGLPELSVRWLNRALETPTEKDTSTDTVGAPESDAALPIVVGCFPSLAPGSVATASAIEKELLLKLTRSRLRPYQSVAGAVSEHDSAQGSATAMMQLAVAAVVYCSADLRIQVRFIASLLASTG